MPSPLDAADLRSRVQGAIDAELSHQRAVLAEVGPQVAHLVDVVEALLTGGKRLRAAFLYWGYRASGHPDGDAIVRLAMSMELFQAAALIHDDVMDDSDLRRGMPAAHRALAGHHREHAWEGSADRFGLAGAVLAGNLCLTWADEAFATCGLPAEQVARGRSTFDQMRTQLMAGQFLDVIESVRPWDGLSTSERIERASHVIRYKSAKYSIEQPLLIGAAAGGLDAGALAALSRYGLALGHAFQLRDDVLGVFGDPSETGKPAGDDIREGKRTVLIAHALDRADALGRAEVSAALGREDLPEGTVARVRAVLVESGAAAAVESEITTSAQQARAALESVADLEPSARAVLADLIDVTTSRST